MKLYTALAVFASRTLSSQIEFGSSPTGANQKIYSYDPVVPRRPFYYDYTTDINLKSVSEPQCIQGTTLDMCDGGIYSGHVNLEKKDSKYHDRPVYYSDDRTAYRVPGWMKDDNAFLVDNTKIKDKLTETTGTTTLQKQSTADNNVPHRDATWKTKPQRPSPTEYAFYVRNSKQDIIEGRIQPHIKAPAQPQHLSSAIYLGSFERSFERSSDKSIIFLNEVKKEMERRLGPIDSKTPFAINTGVKSFTQNQQDRSQDQHDPWGFISDYWYRDGYLFAFIPSDKVHGAMTYGESFPSQTVKAEMKKMELKGLLADLKSRNMLKALVEQIDANNNIVDFFKSNNLLRTIVEDVDVSTVAGKNEFQFFPEEHHLEYLRNFCRKMGGELWAPASQAEYEDIVERKGGVCSNDRAFHIEEGKPVDKRQRATSFYLNLHRDGYMRPLQGSDQDINKQIKTTDFDKRSWDDWVGDNREHIATWPEQFTLKPDPKKYGTSKVEESDKTFTDSKTNSRRSRFYTTDNWFADEWDQMCKNHRSEYHYATFYVSETCDTDANDKFYMKPECWRLDEASFTEASNNRKTYTGIDVVNDFDTVLKNAPLRFQKFTPSTTDDINDFQSGDGDNSVRQKNCVIVKCTHTELEKNWEDDDKFDSTWEINRCNQNFHTGICRIRLNSCTSKSYKCNREWTKTCGVLTHYMEESSSWLNKEISRAIDDLRKETVSLNSISYKRLIEAGFKATFPDADFAASPLNGDELSKLTLFTSAQRLGLEYPTLKLTEDIVQSTSSGELRKQRHVLIAYSLQEEAIINKYLEDIRQGKYGKEEQDLALTYGDYPIVKKFGEKRLASDEDDCPCKCETWDAFKSTENLVVGSNIFRDASNYIEKAPDGDQTATGAVGEFVCKHTDNEQNQIVKKERDESICYENSAVAMCLKDPKNPYRHRWFYVQSRTSNAVVDRSQDRNLCRNRCCNPKKAFGDKSRYTNVVGLTEDAIENHPFLRGVLLDDEEFTFKCKSGFHIEGNPSLTEITKKASFEIGGGSESGNSFFTDVENGCFPVVKCTDKKCGACPTFENGFCYRDDPSKIINKPSTAYKAGTDCRCRCNNCFMMAKNTTYEGTELAEQNRFSAHTQYVDVTCKVTPNGLDVRFDKPEDQPHAAKCVPFECKNPHYIYAEDQVTIVGRPLYKANSGSYRNNPSAGCGKSIEYECAPDFYKCDNLKDRNMIDSINSTCEADANGIKQPCFSKPTGTCCPTLCPAGALDEHMNGEKFCWSPVVFKNKIGNCHDRDEYKENKVEMYDSTKKYADGTEVICECFDDYVARKKHNFIDLVFDISLELKCADGDKKSSEEHYNDQLNQVVNVPTDYHLRKGDTAELFKSDGVYATNNDKLVAKCVKGKWKLPSHRCKCQEEVAKEKKACMDMIDKNFNGVCEQRGAMAGDNAVNVINEVVQDLSTNAEIIELKNQIQSLMEKNETVIVAGSSVDMTLIQELQNQVASLESELQKVKEAKPINSTVVKQEANADIGSTVIDNNLVNRLETTLAPSSNVGDVSASGGEDISGADVGASGSTNTATATTTAKSSAFAMKIGYGLIPIAFVQAVHGL